MHAAVTREPYVVVHNSNHIRVYVANRLCVPFEDVTSGLGADLRHSMQEALTYDNPEYALNRRMGISVYGIQPYYRTYGEVAYLDSVAGCDVPCFTMPLGSMSRLREEALALGLQLAISDRRSLKPVCAPSIPDTNVLLHDYQLDVISQILVKQICLVRAPTGSGKTTASIGLIARLKMKTLIVVWSSNLMQQWINRIIKELGVPKSEIGIIRGKKRVVKDITIAMQQTMTKCAADYADHFGLVICDEVQRFAAKTFIAAIEPLCSKYRVGISADETRKDKKEFLIYDTFGQVAAEIKQNRLIEQGHVMDVWIGIIPTGFSHAELSSVNVSKTGPLLDAISVDRSRNVIILNIVKELVLSGRQVLVMCTRREHCLVLDAMFAEYGIRTGTLIGGNDYKVAFEDTRTGMLNGSVRVGVGTIQAVGQGLDIPGLNAVVVASPLASNKQLFGQVRGRVCRVCPGKTEASLFYLWDEHIFGVRSVQNIARWYPSAVVSIGKKRYMKAKAWLAMQKTSGSLKPDAEGE